MNSIWIVVADASRARIFSAEGGNGAITEIQTLAHPQARLHEGDLVSDKAGRDRNPGPSGHHNMGQESEAKQEETVKFAAQVCDELETGRVKGQFGKLYVIAAPGFLGVLRKHQTSSLQKLVAAEISKNLATHDLSQIRSSLPDRL